MLLLKTPPVLLIAMILGLVVVTWAIITIHPIASPSHKLCCPLTCCFDSLLLTSYLFGNLLHTHTHIEHTHLEHELENMNTSYWKLTCWVTCCTHWKHEHHELPPWTPWTPWKLEHLCTDTLEILTLLHPYLGNLSTNLNLKIWKI